MVLMSANLRMVTTGPPMNTAAKARSRGNRRESEKSTYGDDSSTRRLEPEPAKIFWIVWSSCSFAGKLDIRQSDLSFALGYYTEKGR